MKSIIFIITGLIIAIMLMLAYIKLLSKVNKSKDKIIMDMKIRIDLLEIDKLKLIKQNTLKTINK